MLVKLLSKEDKIHFLKLAELLSIADKPLLWDGKTFDQVTKDTNMQKVAFAKGEAESKLIADWILQPATGVSSNAAKTPLSPEAAWPFPKGGIDELLGRSSLSEVDKLLCDLLEDIPLAKNTADSVERIAAVSVALNSLLEGRSTTRYAVRIMLYELMTLAFVSGGISGVERRFLETFKKHHQVDDSDFAEILERTETTFHEVQKTIALVLE